MRTPAAQTISCNLKQRKCQHSGPGIVASAMLLAISPGMSPLKHSLKITVKQLFQLTGKRAPETERRSLREFVAKGSGLLSVRTWQASQTLPLAIVLPTIWPQKPGTEACSYSHRPLLRGFISRLATTGTYYCFSTTTRQREGLEARSNFRASRRPWPSLASSVCKRPH